MDSLWVAGGEGVQTLHQVMAKQPATTLCQANANGCWGGTWVLGFWRDTHIYIYTAYVFTIFMRKCKSGERLNARIVQLQKVTSGL